MSARLLVRDNLDQVFAEMDAFIETAQTIAAARTVNKLADQFETAALRKVTEIYGITASDMREGSSKGRRWLTRRVATPANPEAVIVVRGLGFPLALLKPRPTAKGVTAFVKGRRVLFEGTFMATMKSGHVGVFARGAYGAKSAHRLRATGHIGRFTLGRGERIKRPNKWGITELPINELYTFGPPEAVSNPEVTDAGWDRVEEQAAKVWKQELRFAAR